MNPLNDGTELGERLARLEARLERIEKQIGLPESASLPEQHVPASTEATPLDAGALKSQSDKAEADFEYEVGQNWFAKVGIMVLVLGVAFTLAYPYPQLPPWMPSLVGYGMTAALFALAHFWKKSFELLAKYFHGSGMTLLFFSTLRLCLFGQTHVFEVDSVTGILLLVLAVAINLVIAHRSRSAYLLGLTLLMGYLALYAAKVPLFFLLGLVLLTGLAVEARLRIEKIGLLFLAIFGGFGTYFAWILGHSFQGGEGLKFASVPELSVAVLPVCVLILALGSLLRKERTTEDSPTVVSALFNCALGYGVFLIHSMALLEVSFAPAHLAVSLVFIGIAVTFWLKDQSHLSTFVYVMTGYMALSVAILKIYSMPVVFVWLSLQSLIVVTTAIWFRSRFIVVANFLIYLSIVGAYMLLAEKETGISLWFGVVALLSARILNWQQSRLELKTALMRNAYLLSAFVVFPYALAHLVPGIYVGLAWVGIALLYYALNFLINNQKYRWMGHGTLLLTAIYMVVIGSRNFAPLYRNLSFLVLGVVLLLVSVLFTRSRVKGRKLESEKVGD